MSLVLDSSVTLAWLYSEETSPAVQETFEHLKQAGAWVPSIWRLEVANVLTIGVRRGRHDLAFLQATLANLASLPIQLDPETDRHAWAVICQLAQFHRLTMYDAVYLELAQRRNMPLASLGRELRAAALAEGVSLLGV